MTYTRYDKDDCSCYFYNSKTLNRVRLEYTESTDCDLKIDLEYITDTLVVLSKSRSAIDIIFNDKKFVLKIQDSITINNVKTNRLVGFCYLHSCWLESNILTIKLVSDTGRHNSIIFKFNILTGKISMKDIVSCEYTELRGIEGILCDTKNYIKSYRRVKLLGT